MRISVIGLGKMGGPMARNLIEVGHEVTLYDRTPERAQELAAKGARAAATVAAAVRETQVALTMVPDDEAENALTFGPEGLLAQLPPGAIHLCMSTLGLETSRKLALAHAEAGQGYVAAPVFGRPGAAVSRHLWIVVGGPDTQVTRCLTIFETLGRGITRVGPRAELAHALKLGGDMLTAMMVEGLAEVLAYGEKAGLAPAEYLRLLNTAIFKSPMMDTFGGLMVRHMHEPADLTLAFALKEAQAAIQTAEELEAVMPMVELLQHRFEIGAVQGWGAQDLTVLSRSSRRAAGLEEPEPESEAVPKADHPAQITAQSPEGEVVLDLNKITHFELIKDAVWAWTQGQRYCTSWKYLTEVEKAFGHIPFLRLHRHILLQPEAALARKTSPGAAQKPATEEKAMPLLPSPEEHPVAHSAKAAEKLVLPEPTQTPRREIELTGAWAATPRKRYLSFFKDLAEKTLDRIPSLRQPSHVLVPPRMDETDPACPPKALGEERVAPGLPGKTEHLPDPPGVEDVEPVRPELADTTHFELENGVVWAWTQGKRQRTGWRNLAEVEAAFSHVFLLKIQRNVLLHPELVHSLQPTFGGRSKVKVAGDLELEVSKAATQRLKEVLGM